MLRILASVFVLYLAGIPLVFAHCTDFVDLNIPYTFGAITGEGSYQCKDPSSNSFGILHVRYYQDAIPETDFLGQTVYKMDQISCTFTYTQQHFFGLQSTFTDSWQVPHKDFQLSTEPRNPFIAFGTDSDSFTQRRVSFAGDRNKLTVELDTSDTRFYFSAWPKKAECIPVSAPQAEEVQTPSTPHSNSSDSSGEFIAQHDPSIQLGGATFQSSSISQDMALDQVASESKNQLKDEQTEQEAESLDPNRIKIFRCKPCKKLFTNSTLFRRHSRVHSLTNHQCKHSKCNYGSYELENLIRHIRIHQSEDSLVCTQCGKNSGSYKSLERHRATHLKLLPWECETCRRFFKQKSHLDFHIARSHGGESDN